jgi:hypothetical protein
VFCELVNRKEQEIEAVLGKLAKSQFRNRIHLNAKERAYLQDKGTKAVLEHAAQMIERRLAPANPPRDGRQTPWHGHPVFVAQHATATCCRGCLTKWHGIPKGRALTGEEKRHVVATIARWLWAEEPTTREEGAGDQWAEGDLFEGR